MAIMTLCRAYTFAEAQQVPFVLTFSARISHLNPTNHEVVSV